MIDLSIILPAYNEEERIGIRSDHFTHIYQRKPFAMS